jgi:hypothetical protein
MICEDRGRPDKTNLRREILAMVQSAQAVGKQLGSIRFELRSHANPRFPCLIPDELSLPGSRTHTRLTSVSGAVHRKRSRDRAGRAGSFSFPSANPILGGTIRRRILEQPAERERPFPRNSIEKMDLFFLQVGDDEGQVVFYGATDRKPTYALQNLFRQNISVNWPFAYFLDQAV